MSPIRARGDTVCQCLQGLMLARINFLENEYEVRQLGGDPAAGSPAATLSRLLPSCNLHARCALEITKYFFIPPSFLDKLMSQYHTCESSITQSSFTPFMDKWRLAFSAQLAGIRIIDIVISIIIINCVKPRS